MSVEQGQGMLTVAAVLHELEGRSASISTLAEVVRLDPRKADANWLVDHLLRVECAAREIHRIIGAIKTLEDRSAPRRETIDISVLSAEILKKQIACSLDLARTDIRVQSNIRLVGDPEQVEVLLSNLLGNALKFSRNREKPEVRVTATGDCGCTIVHVSDNGVGLAPEDARRIFKLFAQCHSGFAGSGVGLAIANRIVQRHGGRIWAEGELGV